MKKNEKVIFSIQKKLTLKEYQQFIKNFPSLYWGILKEKVLGLFIIFIVGGTIFQIASLEIFLWILIGTISYAIYYKAKLSQIAERQYYHQIKNHTLYENSKLEFYNTYLIEINEDMTRKVEYVRIKKTIETETDFYLVADSHIILVPKNNCNNEQLMFIRKIQLTHDIDKTEKQKNDTLEKSMLKNNRFISILLNIILIVTIFSVYGALYTKVVISKTLPMTLDISPALFFWLWLPIPLISIILGIIYRKKVKTKKNMIIGVIASVILFVLGGLTFLSPTVKVEYKEIKPYQKILNINIPPNGIYYKDKSTMLYSSEYIKINSKTAYFSNKKSRKKLENEIAQKEEWVQGALLENDVNMLLPYDLRYEDNSYYLIYNNDTAEYNTLPKEDGEYNMIVAIYNKDTFTLQINKYKLNYKERVAS